MRRRMRIAAAGSLSAILGAAIAARLDDPPRASGPVPQGVYLWQRDGTPAVERALREAGGSFSPVCALAAEVSFGPGGPRVARAALDPEALRSLPGGAVLCLRIGPYGDPFDEGAAATRLVADLAESIVESARRGRLPPAELQLDFDCAESKLDGYRAWVEAIRRRVAPTPVSITALPSWLDSPAFRRLAAAAGSYVLQAHSVERPAGPDAPFVLCDPATAIAWVERAGRLGVPFRVALPTYGYLAGFAPDGRLAGLSAEGPARAWPQGTRLREVRSDPDAMAALVRRWTRDRPAALRGIVWFRLPVEGDERNWRLATLAAVSRGETPRRATRIAARRAGPGLVDLGFVNGGERDEPPPAAVAVRVEGAALVAADGLGGYAAAAGGPGTFRLVRAGGPAAPVPPGGQRAIGWVRLDRDAEVQADASTDP